MTALRPWHTRISARIAVAFGGLFLVSGALIQWAELSGLPGGLSVGWSQHLQNEELQRIGSAADAKKRHLEEWIRERRADLQIIAGSPGIIAFLRSQGNPRDPSRKREAQALLDLVNETHGLYDGIFLIDGRQGRVIAAGYGRSNSDPAPDLVARMIRSDLPESLLIDESAGQKPKLIITRKVGDDTSASGLAVIVLDLESEIGEQLDDVLQEFLGRSGEVGLYDPEGHRINAARDPVSPVSGTGRTDRNRAVQLAIQGGEGVTHDIDDRGVAVLAAYRHVRITPEVGWGMVVKKDEAEVLETLGTHRKTFAALGLIGLVIVLAAALVVARWIAGPIRQVVEAAREIQGGRLTARARVTGNSEVADLAHTFNTLAEKFEKWHVELDNQVRRQTEVIRSQEGRLLAFSETTNDAIIAIDDAGLINYWNPAAARIFGHSSDEAIGKQVHALLAPPDLIERADAAHGAYVAAGRGDFLGKVRELSAVRKSGERITVELTVSPLRIDDRWHAIGTLRDITRRKKEENLLRTIAEQLSVKVGDEYFRTLASGLAGFVGADYVLVGELLQETPGRIGTIGLKAPPGLDDPISYALAGTPCAHVLEQGAYSCRDRLADDFPADLRIKNLHAEAYTGIALTDGSGKAIGLVAVMWRYLADVSDDAETCLQIFAAHAAVELERTLAQRQLDRYAQQLEEMVAARTHELTDAIGALRHAQGELVESEKLASLGRLVAGVAHELNTPIGNSVTVSTTLLERARGFDALIASGSLKRSALTEFCADVQQGTRLLAGSLRQAAELIHDFKQVAVDQTSSQRRPFNLRTVVDEIVATLHPRLKKTSHQVVLDIPAEIDLDSYPGPLGQVLVNLLQNALVHAFDGRENGEIRMQAATPSAGRVSITLADNGVGMDEPVRVRVFEPFFTTKLGRGGSGLGLNIVYNIVTGVLGGRISVESTPGSGTRFHIDIPLVAPRPEDRTAK